MNKIWLKSYPDNVPEEITTPEFKSIRDMIEFSMTEFAERPSFTNMGTTLTYRDLDALSMQFACYLQQTLGLIKGERVAIMLPNILQYSVALCGIFRAGLIVVNVNPLYTPRELKHQISDSGARCIIILDNFAHTLEQIIDKTSIDYIVTTQVGDLLKFPKNILKQGGTTNLSKSNSIMLTLRSYNTRVAQRDLLRARCSAIATWYLMYTRHEPGKQVNLIMKIGSLLLLHCPSITFSLYKAVAF
jgi:acyl-CoA synthetase (AMP-forming)/AMP-acid ligase II